jgi:GNAT superfamily N-acetyltransferase
LVVYTDRFVLYLYFENGCFFTYVESISGGFVMNSCLSFKNARDLFDATQGHCSGKIRDNFPENEMAGVIEENFIKFRTIFQHLAGAKLIECPDLLWIDSGFPCPTWNGVLQARLSSLSRIDDIQNYFRSKKLPMSWWVGPGTRPADLGSRLKTRGFIHVEDFPGMAIDLWAFTEDFAMPGGLSIKPVCNLKDLTNFTYVVKTGFQLPYPCARALLKLFCHLSREQPSLFYHYLGIFNGKPVATSSLFFAAGVAGIYLVCTAPGVRGRGFATAMTLAAMRKAAELGCRVVILRASQMGEGMYRRIGFREYCKLGLYVWKNRE